MEWSWISFLVGWTACGIAMPVVYLLAWRWKGARPLGKSREEGEERERRVRTEAFQKMDAVFERNRQRLAKEAPPEQPEAPKEPRADGSERVIKELRKISEAEFEAARDDGSIYKGMDGSDGLPVYEKEPCVFCGSFTVRFPTTDSQAICDTCGGTP